MRMNWDAIGAVGEVLGAAAVVASLIYLARQMRMGNRLARSEAFREPNSELNSLNQTFGLDPVFRQAFRKVLKGAGRAELEPDEKTVLDFYFVSVTNIYDQLSREIREGIVNEGATDFGGKALFELPFYADSWSLYREYFNSSFVDGFEAKHGFDSSIEAEL